MVDDSQTGTETTGSGERRGKDRRKNDRRRTDRRLPSPWWRRPWALVAYGVVGTLLVVLLFNRSRPPQIPAGGEEAVTTAPPGTPVAESPPPAPTAPVENARRMADHERLMAEGDAAKGRILHVELYCSSISPVALRGVQPVESSIVELADAGSRVPAAECKWGPPRGTEARADVLLLVPPHLAEAFADAPTVDDGFVRRRRIEGSAEWVGRSEALALRTGLVLHEYPMQATR
jgi:hypothetical protein